ncbi:MAG: hypothetical protein R3282_07155, partial [Rhodothermales bacterium]|nr:hypothetical protein [Rhodothermales bacterium]
GDLESVRRGYENRLVGIGEKVVLHDASREASRVEGVLKGIDTSGGAMIETSPGTVQVLFAGQVTTVRPDRCPGEAPASI